MSDVVAVGIHLLNSTYTSDKYFNCSEDICLIGRDYCDTFHHRCALCSDHEENCFTNRQQQNCTQFCMDGWMKKHQANCGSQNDECSVWKYIAIGETCILFLMLIMLIIYLLRSRLKSCFGRCYRNPEYGPANTKQPKKADLPMIDSVEDLASDDPITNGEVHPRPELRSSVRYQIP
ncbi:hypothetical protein CHS0354_028340 [Potamilus streckersoni]|uniref:Uncharacterized protein n=1 Tax=Potamilus streckersoni TaxID=2493646 RepID=A0AAE0RU07_9BIVA|nr:hypothetical protein CHS0354_028340 [Potamilus streckersoni]